MDNETMQTVGGEAEGSEGTDSFLEGWEETGGDGAAVPDAGESPEAFGAEEAETAPGEEGTAAPDGTEGDDGQPEDERQSAGNALPEGEEQPEGQQPPVAPRTWTLTREGRSVVIGEADVPALAQKGLDYDRLQAAYDGTRPVMELFEGFARQAGLPVEEYVLRLRAQAKQAQGMDAQEARRAVELEDREARLAAREEQERQRQEVIRQVRERQEQQRRRAQADIQEFIGVYPEAARDYQSIPQEVWDAVNGGMSLVAAYSRYHNAQEAARAQAQAEEWQRQKDIRRQNAENAARSAGSMRTAGSGHGPKDPFLEGWDEN